MEGREGEDCNKEMPDVGILEQRQDHPGQNSCEVPNFYGTP